MMRTDWAALRNLPAQRRARDHISATYAGADSWIWMISQKNRGRQDADGRMTGVTPTSVSLKRMEMSLRDSESLPHPHRQIAANEIQIVGLDSAHPQWSTRPGDPVGRVAGRAGTYSVLDDPLSEQTSVTRARSGWRSNYAVTTVRIRSDAAGRGGPRPSWCGW